MRYYMVYVFNIAKLLTKGMIQTIIVGTVFRVNYTLGE